MEQEPVDCVVDDWKDTGLCSRPCGDGKQKQSRVVVTHPLFGGLECPPLFRVVSCNSHPCVDETETDASVGRPTCGITPLYLSCI